MEKLKTMYVIICFAMLAAQGCTNYKPEKGNHYKDMEDTVKKDSAQAPVKNDPQDTSKKY